MSSLKEYFERVQSPEKNSWHTSDPAAALAMLMVYAHGFPEFVPFEDSDEIIQEFGEVVWNALHLED